MVDVKIANLIFLSLLIGLTWVVHLSHQSNIVNKESPCPNFFRYYRDTETKEFMAIVEIPAPPKGVAFSLKLTLSIAVPLPTKYVGRVELAQNRKESIKNVERGKSLFYKVHFPLQRPLPQVTSIYFNGVLFCHGPPAFGPLTTAIYLEHIFHPSVKSQNKESKSSEVKPTAEPIQIIHPINTNVHKSTTELITETSITTESSENMKFTTPQPVKFIHNLKNITNGKNDEIKINNEMMNCGSVEEFRPLINNRKTLVSSKEWPWLTSIYVKIGEDFKFQCLGNLISNKHVITVAHCIKFLVEDTESKIILASFRRSYLDYLKDNESINRQVIEIIMHPNTKPYSVQADVAILVLLENIKFTNEIRPICLWAGTKNAEKFNRKWGYVAGWDIEETGIKLIDEKKPMLRKMPIMSQNDCFQRNKTLFDMLANETFCAGKLNENISCKGPSGKGFIIYNSYTKKYHLKGLSSSLLLKENTSICNLSKYTIFIDIDPYVNWIIEKIEQSSDFDDEI